jgi:hypothetical protein
LQHQSFSRSRWRIGAGTITRNGLDTNVPLFAMFDNVLVSPKKRYVDGWQIETCNPPDGGACTRKKVDWVFIARSTYDIF